MEKYFISFTIVELYFSNLANFGGCSRPSLLTSNCDAGTDMELARASSGVMPVWCRNKHGDGKGKQRRSYNNAPMHSSVKQSLFFMPAVTHAWACHTHITGFANIRQTVMSFSWSYFRVCTLPHLRGEWLPWRQLLKLTAVRTQVPHRDRSQLLGREFGHDTSQRICKMFEKWELGRGYSSV